MAKKVKKTLKTKISPKIVKKSKPQKVVKQKKQSPKIKKPIAKPKSKSTKKLVVKTKQKKQSPKTKQPTPKAKPKKVVKTKKPIAKPKSKSTKKLVVKTKQKKQSPKTKKPTPKAKPKKVVNTKPISKQKKIKVIKQKVTKVIKPKVDLNSQYVTNEELAKRLDRIFNTKVNKKQTGEAQIRLSTLLKEVGNHEFTEDQIKFISRMLSENNVSISGRGDKYNSPLNTYLSDHNVKTKTSSDSSSSNGIIKRMFQTLAASKPLTEEDEKKYIKMLGSKNENVRKIGRENLIISNLRLVASIARKHINKGVQLEDLILEGYLGLIKTVDKFD
jgi:RNA polymerase primary sigma factor